MAYYRMNEDQCSVCGIGFFLPSGVCDHCDQPRTKVKYDMKLDTTALAVDGKIQIALEQAGREISRWVIDTREQVIRDGLIRLGWTPPSDSGGSNEIEQMRTLYHELLYAVACKFEGETRHETALRYIRDRENDRTVEMEKSKNP